MKFPLIGHVIMSCAAIDKNSLDLKKEDSSFIFLRMKDINSIDNCTSTALVDTIKDI